MPLASRMQINMQRCSTPASLTRIRIKGSVPSSSFRHLQFAVKAVPDIAESVARPVMLSTGTLWILGQEADRYYNVRGQDFVIGRAEAMDQDRSIGKAKTRATTHKPAPLMHPSDAYMHQAVWQYGSNISMITDASDVLDVPEEWVAVMGPALEEQHAVSSSPVTSLVWVPKENTSVGLVPVHSPGDDTDAAAADGSDAMSEDEVYQTDSSSPRRTKMLRFRCVAAGCRALNLKPMNPHCFTEGTAFAQCSKCKVWHLIRDNLRLFNQMKGPIFVPRSQLQNADLPPSLRLPEDGTETGVGWAGAAPKP